ncbi:uncharacterized protein LOC128993614 [Macrosteles quadrilineatus]|uniref:uncharacterized protein LOC128993614 n=1 Tax=Macrosteles quadrilineatus TaxID=74068 RepID=UPI0023E2BAD3|nr:uncharacterized protein LOC128993614 [Macrosteles quadrilineatus]
MITVDNAQCIQHSLTKKVQWMKNSQEEDNSNNFVPLRKSRKGIQLNNPEEFDKVEKELSTITRMAILPTQKCCFDQVSLKNRCKQLTTKENGFELKSSPASIIINIGTSMPFHLNSNLLAYSPERSRSKMTVNTKLINEEHGGIEKIKPLDSEQLSPCTKNEDFGEENYQILSSEERILDYEIPNNFYSLDNVTYIKQTASLPKITPFKSCWSCICCKRNEKEQVYLPSGAEKWDWKNSRVAYPAYTAGNAYNGNQEQGFMRVVPSRLSTIVESQSSLHSACVKCEPKK